VVPELGTLSPDISSRIRFQGPHPFPEAHRSSLCISPLRSSPPGPGHFGLVSCPRNPRALVPGPRALWAIEARVRWLAVKARGQGSVSLAITNCNDISRDNATCPSSWCAHVSIAHRRQPKRLASGSLGSNLLPPGSLGPNQLFPGSLGPNLLFRRNPSDAAGTRPVS
jgi:hypothetical protein